MIETDTDKLNKVYTMLCTTVKESVDEAIEIVGGMILDQDAKKTRKSYQSEPEDDPVTGLRIELGTIRIAIREFEVIGREMDLEIKDEPEPKKRAPEVHPILQNILDGHKIAVGMKKEVINE